MKTSPVYEIPAGKYNDLLAKALKQIPEFKHPEWSLFVKSGVSKIKPPQEDDFWYKRAASILRQAYIRKVIGVNRLKTRYGSKLNRGMKPERFRKASGKIIRTILQQAEEAGLLEKYNEPGRRAGRKLTKKGKELLEGIKLSEKTEETKPITDTSLKPKVEEENQKATEIKSDKVEENIEIKEDKGE